MTAVFNKENASAFDGPLLLLLCPRLHRRQGRILLIRKSQSRHRLAFEIQSSATHPHPGFYIFFIAFLKF
ncbi:hypothetical protein TNCV_3532501 [Trichonephila clavipes]|nr:hypothetical protein TNCV_3532501 [Trichonephila clavipes]